MNIYLGPCCKLSHLVFLLILIITISGCAQTPATLSRAATVVAHTKTATPSATATQPLPTSTLMPTLLPATSMPVGLLSELAIVPGKIDQVHLLQRWGTGRLSEAAWSPDGNWVALASSIGIYLYRANRMEESAQLIETNIWVRCVAFSQDSQTLAGGMQDGSVKLWHMADLGVAPQNLEGHTAAVLSLAFSPRGKLLASGSEDGTARLWLMAEDMMNEQASFLQILLGHTAAVNSVAFSPHGRALASGSTDTQVILWHIPNDTRPTTTLVSILKGHEGAVNSVAFSSDKQTLASGSSDKTVRLWRVSGVGEPDQEIALLRTLEQDQVVQRLTFFGEILAGGLENGMVRLWHITGESETPALLQHTLYAKNGVNGLVYSSDGNQLLVLSTENVQLWATGGALSNHSTSLLWEQNYTPGTTGLAISPDGKFLAGGSYSSGQIRLLADGSLVYTLDRCAEDHVNGIVFSPDGKLLAGGSQNMVCVWRASDGHLLRKLAGHIGNVTTLAFSANGQFLASGSEDKTIYLWSTNDGHAVHMFYGHTGTITGLAFIPDGLALASGSLDGTARLWRISDGQMLLRFKDQDVAVNSIALAGGLGSLPGYVLASGLQDGAGQLWHINNWTKGQGSNLRTLEGHPAAINQVAFSPDGQILVSVLEDGHVDLWQTMDGMLLKTLEGHTASVIGVTFSPDGRYLVTTSYEDGTIRIWGIE